MDEEHLKARVRRRLKSLGLGHVDAALKAGLQRDYLRDWFSGRKKTVKRDALAKIAAVCKWSLSELMDDKENYSVETVDENPVSIVNVPEIEVRVGLSYAGGFNKEENTTDEFGNTVGTDAVRSLWSIPRPFLRDEMHIRGGRAHILPVRGDSMTDALFDGDRAIINLDDTDVSQGGIFALVDDNGSVIIKQVELVRGESPRRIRCTSRNIHYKPFELVLDDPVKVVGRVACKITRL